MHSPSRKKTTSRDGNLASRLDLAAALDRLGLPPPHRLTRPTTVALARTLGLPVHRHVNLINQVKADTELRDRVVQALVDRFPDLVRPEREPGVARGRTMAPLAERVGLLLSKTPEADRLAGLHIEEVRRRVRGVFGPTARVGETAEALRANGWVRCRSWSVDEQGRHRTAWFPPRHPAAQAEVARLQRLAARRRQQHDHPIEHRPAQEHTQ